MANTIQPSSSSSGSSSSRRSSTASSSNRSQRSETQSNNSRATPVDRVQVGSGSSAGQTEQAGQSSAMVTGLTSNFTQPVNADLYTGIHPNVTNTNLNTATYANEAVDQLGTHQTRRAGQGGPATTGGADTTPAGTPTPTSGQTTETTPRPGGAAADTPETGNGQPRPTPRSQDMRDYVEAVDNHNAELRAGNRPAAGAAGAVDDAAAAAQAGQTRANPTPATGGADDAVRSTSGTGRVLTNVAQAGAIALGPAATAMGVAETVGGIRDAVNGQNGTEVAGGVLRAGSGAATAVSASTGTAAGIAHFAGRAATAAAVGTVGTVAGGIGAVADGVRDIVTGQDAYTRTVGGVKTAAGGAMMLGVATANPLLVAGGAATYVGASLANTETGRAVVGAVGDGVQAVGNAIGSGAQTIGNAASSAWSWATSWW